MLRKYKYDVAISVAEEDIEIATQIAAALEMHKIRRYYYEERATDSWGEYLMDLTRAAYGRDSRFVLLIISKSFIKKYWSNIERQIAFSDRTRRYQHILPLRLDDVETDGLSNTIVFIRWLNNPDRIATILHNKIRARKRAENWQNSKQILTVSLVLIALVMTWYLASPKSRIKSGPGPVRKLERILIPASDTFYISNTEVTVAQYREYCNNMNISFPPQPPFTYENKPVVNINWSEAKAFCDWAGGRLPTEKEWHYAAGAGIQVKYSGSNNAQKVAVYNKLKPAPVASKAPNDFQLYDMTGNVSEWCDNWFDSSHHWKVVRGGAYNSKINPENELAITYRVKELPENRKPSIGFRVVWNK